VSRRRAAESSPGSFRVGLLSQEAHAAFHREFAL
jgi:hypothetical protein